jgi:integrase
MENDVAAIIATTPTNTIGLRDIALLLVGRDMLARRSELAALEVSDLDLDAGTAIIRRSKTDQYGEGAILYLAPRTRGFVRRYLAEAGIVDGCVFRPLSRGGNVRGDSLDARDVARIFRRIVDRTPGLDPVGVSGHSVRIGMAQDLVADGVDLPSLMQAGRWRSPRMPARYGEKLAAGHNAVARWYERRGR